MRIIFMGTAELACPSLEALASCPLYNVAGVITQPDRPKGRELRLTPSPVKIVAQKLSLPVFQPEKIRHASAFETLSQLKPDIIVVAAYGQILPRSVLELPAKGCINVHASLLPKYRGAAPIQWSILNDDGSTGITIMKMDEGLDTGDILAQQATQITEIDDAQSLHDRLAKIGASLLMQTVPELLSGNITSRSQVNSEASYARKITKEDGLIDWNQPAIANWNRIRAFNPWPGAFSFLEQGSEKIMIKIWRAKVINEIKGPPGEILQANTQGIAIGCGLDAVQITELQREGKRRMEAAAFLAGLPLTPGMKLSHPNKDPGSLH